MANVKKKNDVMLVYDKKKNKVVKKSSSKKTTKKTSPEKKTTLTPKERNKQKYQTQQKKYQETIKKEAIDVELKKKPVSKEKEQRRKEYRKQQIKNLELRQKIERKQNRKVKITSVNTKKFTTDRRNPLEITLTNFKQKSLATFNVVREKVDDKTIPIGSEDDAKKKRFIRCVYEAIFYAIAITIINIILYFIFDSVNMLRLFDVKWLNAIVSILLSLIINFMVALLIDYLVTEYWSKLKKKIQEGGRHGNSRLRKRKNKRNKQAKKGK